MLTVGLTPFEPRPNPMLKMAVGANVQRSPH
jgi:hypothetical protein